MKDYLEYHGSTNISGSRDTIKEAFKVGVITDGEGWMDMIESRIKTSHTYNEEIANQIAKAIIESYYTLFTDLQIKLESLISDVQDDTFNKKI